jgi:hypothetical protein
MASYNRKKVLGKTDPKLVLPTDLAIENKWPMIRTLDIPLKELESFKMSFHQNEPCLEDPGSMPFE